MKKLSRIPITQKGYDALLVEQKELKEKRKLAVLNLKAARDLGDLSENGLYKGARFALNGIDRRLRQLDMQIKLADIQDSQKGVMGLGSNVILNDGKADREFQIVGTYEVDPLQNKISLNSPLGRELIGKNTGDSISIHTKSGRKTFVVKKIQ